MAHLHKPDQAVAVFGRFWASDRLLIRRLRTLAMLDAEMEQAVRAQDGRQRGHMRVILGRRQERYELHVIASFDDTVEALHALTGFETFGTLAGTRRSINEVTPTVQSLVRKVAGVGEE